MLNKPLYNDLIGEYILLDFFPTHSQLLFRRKKDKSIEHNIDIVFKQVRLINIPDRLKGVTLTEVIDESSVQGLCSTFNFTVNYGYKIFKLSDASGNHFYINAGAIGLFHNHFLLLESSLGENLTAESNKCVFWHK